MEQCACATVSVLGEEGKNFSDNSRRMNLVCKEKGVFGCNNETKQRSQGDRRTY